jgi:hypothetical protein
VIRRAGVGLAVAVVAAIIATAAGAAYAYFTASGAGSAAGSAGTLTVNLAALQAGDGVTTTLAPGTTGDLIVRINNPNAFAVSLITVTSGGAITADSGHAGCTTTGVTVSVPAADLPVTVAPGSALYTLTGATSMSMASLSACQGATFSVPVTIGVQH